VKKVLLSVFVALLATGFVAPDVQAKRLGGGAPEAAQTERERPRRKSNRS